MLVAKIPKNLSDRDMVGAFTENLTFENDVLQDEKKKTVKMKQEAKSYSSEFFTPDLQEKVGKALLELKVQLYKEGIVDFDIKVSRDAQTVSLRAVPKKAKK
jgi:hypothetical protein